MSDFLGDSRDEKKACAAADASGAMSGDDGANGGADFEDADKTPFNSKTKIF